MKNRPAYFLIYSILLGLIALSLPIQAALITGRSALNLLDGFLMLTPINVILLGICVLTSVFSVNASPKLRVLIPTLLMILILNNLIIMKSGIGFDPSQVAWATAAFALMHIPLMFGARREALQHPRSRWWLVPQRKLVDLPINIKTIQGMRFSTRSFDLSDSGVFVKIDPEVYCHGQTSFLKSMFSGNRMTVKFAVGRFKEIQCQAQVVRCQEQNNGQYPAGLGIRFLDMNQKTKAEITRLLKSQFSEVSHLRV